MDILQLPPVIVDNDGGFKFIVARVTVGDRSATLVRADATLDYHYKIFAKMVLRHVHGRGCPVPAVYTKQEPGLCTCGTTVVAECLGGGLIRIDRDRKTIRVWDRSTDFGREPEREALTVGLLRAAHPDFAVTGD